MTEQPNLNIGICEQKQMANPYEFGCLNVDVIKTDAVDVVCDVQNLPFKNRAFKDVFCFHVLEHINNPARGLKELIRVATRMIEVEVPHRYGGHANNGCKKEDGVAYFHICSFRAMWFHNCLKNFKHCVQVRYLFPLDLLLHVWIYKEGWSKIE